MQRFLLRSFLLSGLIACIAANASDSATTLAELPFWPVGMKLPDSVPLAKPPKNRSRAEILVWTAPEVKHIRAMIVIPNNSDSKDWSMHPSVREVCKKREIGIVFLRNFPAEFIEFTDTPELKYLQFVLDAVAQETGIPEFRHAPWITFGKSSRGRFPFRVAWLQPERTIACITYHGETPTWPMAPWSRVKDESILSVNVNGQNEWDCTWYRHVRPCLLNYRAQTNWLSHQVVAWNVGHGDYIETVQESAKPGTKPKAPMSPRLNRNRVWEYLALYVDKAVALRVPTESYPTDGPITLKKVDPDSGYLIHPRATETLLEAKWRPLRQTDGTFSIVDHIKEPGEVFDPNPGTIDPSLLIRKATDVPAAERRGLFWVADQELADAWRALHIPPKEPGK